MLTKPPESFSKHRSSTVVSSRSTKMSALVQMPSLLVVPDLFSMWRLHGGNLILPAFDHNRTAAAWTRHSHVCYRMTGHKPETLAEPVAHNSSDTRATPAGENGKEDSMSTDWHHRRVLSSPHLIRHTDDPRPQLVHLDKENDHQD